MTLELKETIIETTNLTLSALTSTNHTDLPVLALHGWLDNAASFIPLAKHLSGVHLIALDFPGHGKSSHRLGANAYHFIDYAMDVILAADALQLKQFTLLGHSLGAGVAALIAAVVPDRISRLAMIEGIAPITAPPEDLLTQYKRHVEQTTKVASPARFYQTVEQAARVRQQAGDLSLAAATLIVRRNLTETSRGYAWRTDRRLNRPSPIYLAEEHVSTYLSAVQCEAMLVRANAGILKQWPKLQGREPLLKNLAIVDIDGGHHCHMDSAERVAQVLLPFLHRG